MLQAIERQAAAGVSEADSIVLVMDGQTGLTAADEEIVSWLRRSHPGKPVLLAINKCENPAKADLQVRNAHFISSHLALCSALVMCIDMLALIVQAAEFWKLGLEPIAVSAISGTGTGDLMEQVVATLPPPKPMEEAGSPEVPLPVAIIGRPNVGKSSLLNSLVSMLAETPLLSDSCK
jgi:GTP-binding protein